jgi:hypothetical protein
MTTKGRIESAAIGSGGLIHAHAVHRANMRSHTPAELVTAHRMRRLNKTMQRPVLTRPIRIGMPNTYSTL